MQDTVEISREMEKDLIATSIGDSSQVMFLESEDFEFYGHYWKQMKEAGGSWLKVINRNPELMGFECKTIYTVVYAPVIALKLIERRFKKLLDDTLAWYSKNTFDPSEGFILAKIIEEVNELDILDLVESLPKYFKTTGLNANKITGWSNYCKNRINGIKGFHKG